MNTLTKDIVNNFIVWFNTLDLPRVNNGNDYYNRRKYITYESDELYIMLSSTYRCIHKNGWCLDIVQIEVNEQYQNNGITTSILEYLKNKNKFDFIYVECVHSDILENILRKMNAVNIPELTSWIIYN